MSKPTEEMTDSIVESCDAAEAVINLAPVRFCISLSTLPEFKEELELLIEKHRI